MKSNEKAVGNELSLKAFAQISVTFFQTVLLLSYLDVLLPCINGRTERSHLRLSWVCFIGLALDVVPEKRVEPGAQQIDQFIRNSERFNGAELNISSNEMFIALATHNIQLYK